MRVCADARIWMSQGVRKERQCLCALPLSLSSRLHLLTRTTLQCSCILQGPLFRIFVDTSRDILWLRMGYHMVPVICPLQASLTKLTVVC